MSNTMQPQRPAPDAGAGQEPGLLHFRSPVSFALLIAGLFLLLFNARFWREIVAICWHGSPADALFLAAFALVLLLLCTAALLAAPGAVLLRIAAGLLIPLGATAAFCADSFGLAIDRDMVRSFALADQKEAMAMLSPRLLCYALVLGVLPMFIVGGARISDIGWRRHLLHRLAFAAAALPLSALLILPFAPRFGMLAQQHAGLRYFLVPAAAVQGVMRFARAGMAGGAANADAGSAALDAGAARRVPQAAGKRPLLLFLVLGETARHASFQLGGYARPTNPLLSAKPDLYYFRHVESCGTSTAVSIPCMLSPLGRQRYTASLPAAQRHASLLDALAQGGIHVEWRANNTGGMGLHAGLPARDYTSAGDPALCNAESCLDEILLQGLGQDVDHLGGDTLMVFHQMGSHGPAYYKRYPRWAERFKPACASNELGDCSLEEIRNAYDNSIVYTDHVLAGQIAMLEQASTRFDTALVYVSDHGESLGERGIHLHGAPYEIAPAGQKRVPMILWMSRGYMDRMKLDAGCLRRQLDQPFSHDNLYHTLLGAMGMRNDAYRGGMDMLAACRGDG